MQKKGQLAIFVIIAIVVVAGIIIYFVMANQNKSKTTEVASEVAPINDFVQGCLKQTTIDALYVTGQYGGYYNEAYFDNDSVVIYYTSSNRLIAPSKKVVETQISNYIRAYMDDCFKNFTQFGSFRIAVTGKQVNATLYNESIDVVYRPSITITKDKATYSLDKFESNVSTRYGLMYSVAGKLAQDYIDLGGVNIAYGSRMNDEYNMTFGSTDYTDYTSITMTDPLGVENKDPIQFVFALK